jgi:amphiphysin
VLEDHAGKLAKDSKAFRDSVHGNGWVLYWPAFWGLTGMVQGMLYSSTDFATAFTTVFSPIGGEDSLEKRYPDAATTIQHIASYQSAMSELKDAINPELELIDSRIVAPIKDYQELLKKVRKSITKREHKASTPSGSP